jgi:HicB family
MYELMKNEELWRERRRDSLRRVSGVRRVVDSGSGLGARVRGWLRRGVAILGYRDPESSRVPLEAVQRPGEVRCRRGQRSRRYCVDSKAALTRFEAAVTNQVALAGGDPAVEAAARALKDALGPAARQLALELIEQAAAEVDAQLPYHKVEVVLRGGEPTLEVRTGEESERRPAGEEYDARITLRLPPSLKSAIEEAARTAGESVNSYLVRDLLRSTARPERLGRRMKGTVRT